jgi:hypothetical protein
MAKFAKAAATAAPKGATATLTAKSTFTHEGASAFTKDLRTEFFTLALSNFVGENTFYESGKDRDNRFVALINQLCLTPEDTDWLANCIVWLRDSANMRTAAVVASVEYARLWHKDASKTGREVIRETLTRADEPAEALAYYLSTYGKPIPYAIKRGIADAATKLYNPYSVNKYDAAGHAVRPGDVIELCHPKPQDQAQADLFRYIIETRKGRDEITWTDHLADLAQLKEWHKNPTLETMPKLATWETLSSHTKMDAKAWEAIIPQMGYMARLRNLRNFTEQGVDDKVLDDLANYLCDPENVAKSRQLPFRFYNAYLNASTRFAWSIEKAMRLSVSNIPEFEGETLILIDTSGSMSMAMSQRGTMRMHQAAALFGSAVASRSKKAHTYVYATTCARVDLKGDDILKNVQIIEQASGKVGHGTNTWPALEYALKELGHTPDRVLVFTDMQDHPTNQTVNKLLPKTTPVHVWDLQGYKATNLELGSGRYLYSGLSDQSFKMMKLIEDLKPGHWPWEIN